jgi:hypothetical protein
MAEAAKPQNPSAGKATVAEKKNWIAPVLATWAIPGSGYFMLGKTGRGGLMMGVSVVMFLLGLMMRGTFFEPRNEDLLTTVIYTGGYLCHLASGGLYFLAKAFGYSAPDVAGHVVDYGTKMIVGAGLVNVLSLVDVFEIATGKKQ